MLFTVLIGIWVAAAMAYGFTLPPVEGLKQPAAMYFHVPMAVAMLVTFVFAAYYGAMWLWKRDPRSDGLSLAFAEVGAFCGLIATATGAIWARANWGAYWNWDPQQIGILGTLLTYGALFALRGAVEDEDKKRDLWAVYAILGAVAAVFLTYFFRRLGASLHPDHTIAESSAAYKTALRLNIVGYVMLLVRLAQLRARLENAGQRLKELSWA